MARNASANAFHLFGQGRTIPYGVLMTSKASNHQYDLGVKCQINSTSVIRGVPAYTQSTQLRTLIFECSKNKNVLNRENAIKTCLTRVRSLNTEVYRFCNNPDPKQ